MRTTVVTVLAFTAALAACKRSHRDAPAPTAAAIAPAPAPTTAATPPEMRSLAGRLAFEAAHRPTGTATVEQVLAAAATAGLTVDEPRQYLALTAAAAYCAGGRTADGVAVAVCEYPDPAAAARGREHVERAFTAIAGRDIVVRGATTITTTAPAGVDATATRRALATALATL
jgi:hypothetical protein